MRRNIIWSGFKNIECEIVRGGNLDTLFAGVALDKVALRVVESPALLAGLFTETGSVGKFLSSLTGFLNLITAWCLITVYSVQGLFVVLRDRAKVIFHFPIPPRVSLRRSLLHNPQRRPCGPCGCAPSDRPNLPQIMARIAWIIP